MKISRNTFLKTLVTTGVSLTAGISTLQAATPSDVGFELGLASYTFRKFTLQQLISYTKRLGIKRISLKSNHLPLDADTNTIKAVIKQIRDAGIDAYGAGVIYMETPAAVEQAFEYAKTAELKLIIGVPNHDLLPLVDQKVKEYGIRLAIHNHGPSDTRYPGPSDVYDRIHMLDPRIGLCMDIGHTVRLKQDPIYFARKYKDRLFDCHVKDLTPEYKDIEVGRGIIDIEGFLRALKKTGYSGTLAFEYEKDENDPMPGLSESVGYVRGLLKMM